MLEKLIEHEEVVPTESFDVKTLMIAGASPPPVAPETLGQQKPPPLLAPYIPVHMENDPAIFVMPHDQLLAI
ncbi:MAG: hypothetical protein JO269_03560 [Burkholderiaceae bacterium]|nr:hypothetical protein [Burkholderiaceae bacterium]